jgi:hypothetical protein
MNHRGNFITEQKLQNSGFRYTALVTGIINKFINDTYSIGRQRGLHASVLGVLSNFINFI